jgi:hypothetical protein
MRKVASVSVLSLVAVLATVLCVDIRSARAQSAGPESIFSGVGTFFNGSTLVTPFGFWIWCQGPANNPYAQECAGAMYFYALAAPAVNVDGHPTEVCSNSGCALHVTGSNQALSVDCKLSATGPFKPGPSNVVTVTCTEPAAVINLTGISQNSVVHVVTP